jgi:tungstate transport system substrate-binding protein
VPIHRRLPALLASLVFVVAAACGGNGERELLLGATTSVHDTGLLDELVRGFEDATDYDVKPIVGGSGQIMETARRGEFDVILTHSPEDEDAFITVGEGLDRRMVMRNHFIIAGPDDDPAAASEAATLAEAFERIAAGGHRFVSRGDESGTHRREQFVWQDAGIQPQGEPWYEESATGQGQNLLVASDKDAYTLVDSSTFTVFRDRVALRPLLTDSENPNVYSVIRISTEKHPDVNSAGAIAFAGFLTSPAGQCLIASYGLEDYGKPLFESASACELAARRLTRR